MTDNTMVVIILVVLISSCTSENYIESNERIAKYEIDNMYESCEVTK